MTQANKKWTQYASEIQYMLDQGLMYTEGTWETTVVIIPYKPTDEKPVEIRRLMDLHDDDADLAEMYAVIFFADDLWAELEERLEKEKKEEEALHES